MVQGIPQRPQPQNRVHPGRLDPAPGAVRLLPVDQPPLGGGKTAPLERFDVVAIQEPQRFVQAVEDAPPREQRAGALDGELPPLRRVAPQLLDARRPPARWSSAGARI